MVLAKKITIDKYTISGEIVHTGYSTKQIINHIEIFESDLKLTRNSFTIWPAEAAHRSKFTIVTGKVHAKTLKLPPLEEKSILDPVAIGLNMYGKERRIKLYGYHALIAGSTGSGKSTTMRILLANLIHMVDAEVFLIDLKNGAESQHWEEILGDHHIANNVVEAKKYLDYAEKLIEQQAKLMKVKKMGSTFQPSKQTPAKVFVIDEAKLLINAGFEKQLDVITSLGRAAGVFVIYATQYVNAKTLPTGIRDNLAVKYGHRVGNPLANSQMHGSDALVEGWEAHKLPGGENARGWMQINEEGVGNTERLRAYFISDKDVPHIIESAFKVRGPWPDRLEGAKELTESEITLPGESKKGDSKAEILFNLISSAHGISVKELEVQTGISRAHIYRLLEKLEAEEKVKKLENGKWGVGDKIKK